MTADLDEHPVVRRSRQQPEKLRSHGQVVFGVLIREFADHVNRAADDAAVRVLQPLLDAIERQPQALRVFDEKLVPCFVQSTAILLLRPRNESTWSGPVRFGSGRGLSLIHI